MINQEAVADAAIENPDFLRFLLSHSVANSNLFGSAYLDLADILADVLPFLSAEQKERFVNIVSAVATASAFFDERLTSKLIEVGVLPNGDDLEREINNLSD